jgi:hypothetical protein
LNCTSAFSYDVFPYFSGDTKKQIQQLTPLFHHRNIYSYPKLALYGVDLALVDSEHQNCSLLAFWTVSIFSGVCFKFSWSQRIEAFRSFNLFCFCRKKLS